MKTKGLILLAFQFAALTVPAQCVIHSEVQPNGTIQKETEKELFYYTKSYSLHSACVYDGRNYYLEIIIKPTPGNKAKKDTITLKLENGKTVKLKFYDTYKNKKDTSVNVLFELDKEVRDILTKHDIEGLSFLSNEGFRSLITARHGGLVRKQLNCLIAERKKE